MKGSVLRSRSKEEKTRILAALKEEVWPLIASGQVKPLIHDILPIKDAEQAHILVKSNQTIGKVVLRIG